MSSDRAAAEIEPVERMASKSAILPGPMRAPDARSMRIERWVSAMYRYLAEPSRCHSDRAAAVKGLCSRRPALPRRQSDCGGRSRRKCFVKPWQEVRRLLGKIQEAARRTYWAR